MRTLFCAAVLSLFCMISVPSKAQFFKKLGKEVSKRVENKVINDAGRASEKGVDKAEKGASDAVTGKNEKSKPSEKRKSNQAVSAGSQGKSGAENQAQPGTNINSGYDFEPGEHTIFEIDFTKEQVGNFPRRLEFIKGNLAVVDRNGKRFGRVKGKTEFAIQLPEKLPNKFTIQLKLHNAYWLGYVNLFTTKEVKKGETYFSLYRRRDGVGVVTKDGPESLGNSKVIEKEVVPIEIMVDGDYAKMYVDHKRVANIPQTNIKRTDKLYFDFKVGSDDPDDFGYITDIRVAGGGRTLYQQLESDGRVAFHDIHFATGKADILPASESTIKTVADLLNNHPDLKLLIEGHTDNTGNFDKNMELSKDRAAAVKTYLVNKFGIAADRLRTMGQGQTQPVADNDTEEGRAENRRVEIVKM